MFFTADRLLSAVFRLLTFYRDYGILVLKKCANARMLQKGVVFMECPKCHKSVDDDDIFCPNCDTRLRPDKNTSIMKRFKKQNKPLNVEIVGEKKHKLSESKLKLILITVAVVLLVVLVVLIVVNIISGKGENTAESISEYIGVDVAKAQKKLIGASAVGFSTVIILQLLTSSIIMFSLGIIGFYLSKIYEEIKQRPRYIIRDIIRKDDEEKKNGKD